ncbi:MAG: hypothetical protein QNJ30_15250 [Kiloniellales bacterium]|nr:hypothetical protein [Kiloniellales bacterium]
MAKRTPFHEILAVEAKARGYKRCGSAWAKDYGDLVAHVHIDRSAKVRHHYSCWISLFIKVEGVPPEYTQLIEELKLAPGSLHIYIPPKRSPDRTSHLLKLVNKPQIGPSKDGESPSSLTEEERKTEETIRKVFTLYPDSEPDAKQLEQVRRLMIEWGFDKLALCKSRAELAERFTAGAPPFGVFFDYAKAYLT